MSELSRRTVCRCDGRNPIIFLLGSLDHITVVTADGKLALNQIGQISMKSPQLILVNMASFPECTAAAIKAIRESGMNLNPEVEGTLIRVPIPK
ncbi:hypothetical protein HPG69_017826 [Diceros bicornis minor]|uniref:Ribosome-recycling factor, mitochondrial n=1 Tax=Diceros bicornis minor TaxID=77932 RepID=A0A7J7F5L0_DICBM|nr:hypothetical protein HPG69_017826 [Diceros bicornis minor]